MIPTITAVRMSASGREELPLLVLGPSLGTSAASLWSACARGLTDAFDVLAWDLPGHGHNRGVPEEDFTMAELAVGVLRVVDDVVAQRTRIGETADPTFAYAGDSVGGAVGLQLLLDAPERVASAVLLCTGARIGTPQSWRDRIAEVVASGTEAMLASSAERWFGPGFLEREPEAASRLLRALAETADDGYARVCAALADFDVRGVLADIDAPVLAVAGARDPATPTASLAAVADAVADGSLVELPGVGHLAPAEAPERVAALIREHLLGAAGPDTEPEAPAGDLVGGLADLLAGTGWDDVWSRPGLDRRSRSLVALTAMVAGGHHDELAVQVRTARSHGLSAEEISECLVQCAVHCGVPAAATALRIAQRVLDSPADAG